MPYENIENLLDQSDVEDPDVEDYVESGLRKLLKDLTLGLFSINSDKCTYRKDEEDEKWYHRHNRNNNLLLSGSRSPLLTAIQCKNVAATRALVQDGADVCKCGGPNNRTPLIEAMKEESAEIVEILLKNGAELTVPSAFLFAIKQVESSKRNNYEEIINLLISAGADVNARNEDGPTLLEIHIKRGDVKMAEILLRAGASVNGTTTSGQSPLALAASLNNLTMVTKLASFGADIDLIADEDCRQFADSNVDFAIYLRNRAEAPLLSLLKNLAVMNRNKMTFEFTRRSRAELSAGIEELALDEPDFARYLRRIMPNDSRGTGNEAE